MTTPTYCRFATALLLASFAAACAHTSTEKEAKAIASAEAQKVASEEKAPFVTELSFRKNARTLSVDDQQQLDKLIRDARAHGEIDNIKVVTWADQEYPSTNAKKLSSAQRDLADRRNSEIKTYIHTVDSKADVDTYNMAERPGVLSELMNTSNARIKKALEASGIPNTDSGVKQPSKASKSIVMVILKE
jgi:hypothetical protein